MALPRAIIRGGSAAALQVSLPGYNVLTANLNNMAFDARFANMTIVMRIDVSFPEIRETQATYSTDVYFGETFMRPPSVFARIEQTTASFGAAPGPNSNNSSWVYQDGAAATNGYIGNIYTDHMTLQSLAYRPARPSDNFWWPSTFHLLVLRP